MLRQDPRHNQLPSFRSAEPLQKEYPCSMEESPAAGGQLKVGAWCPMKDTLPIGWNEVILNGTIPCILTPGLAVRVPGT